MIGKPVALIQVPNQRLFGPGAAARYLGMGPERLKQLTDLGHIKAYDDHGRRGYRLEDMDAYIEKLPEWHNRRDEDLPATTGGERHAS